MKAEIYRDLVKITYRKWTGMKKHCMIAMLIAAVITFTACEKNISSTPAAESEEAQTEEKQLITEGVDTPIRIVEYPRALHCTSAFWMNQ